MVFTLSKRTLFNFVYIYLLPLLSVPVCLSLSLVLSVSVCLSFSLLLSVFLSLYLSFFLPLSHFLYVSVAPSPTPLFLYLCLSLCLSLFPLSFYLFRSLCFPYIFASLPPLVIFFCTVNPSLSSYPALFSFSLRASISFTSSSSSTHILFSILYLINSTFLPHRPPPPPAPVRRISVHIQRKTITLHQYLRQGWPARPCHNIFVFDTKKSRRKTVSVSTRGNPAINRFLSLHAIARS